MPVSTVVLTAVSTAVAEAGLPPECARLIPAPTERPILVAVLSPRMVYSVLEWPRLRAVAEQEGFDIVAWWAPGIPYQESEAAAIKAGWDIKERTSVGITPAECRSWVGWPNHFPFSRVMVWGRAHEWPIWGVMPDGDWRTSLTFRAGARRMQREMTGKK